MVGGFASLLLSIDYRRKNINQFLSLMGEGQGGFSVQVLLPCFAMDLQLWGAAMASISGSS